MISTPNPSDLMPGPDASAGIAPNGETNGAPAGPPPESALCDDAVGDGNHEVKPGESIVSIAETEGFFWETLWNHAANAEVKSRRKNPNILLAGDRVEVIELRRKSEPGALDQRHRFVRRGVPSKLRMCMMEGQEPRAEVPYTYEVDGRTWDGATDDEGCLALPIPPGARRGRLTLNDEERVEVFDIDLGSVDPLDTTTGLQQRLRNLTYYHRPITGEMDRGTQLALMKFQNRNRLDATGVPDRATLDVLEKIHGS